VRLTGSLKFDGVRMDRENADTRRLSELAGFAPTDIVFLAGSTQAPEESLALEAFARLQPRYPHLRLVIVPRHITRSDEIAELLNRSGIEWQRRSELGGSTRHRLARVLLVDTIGELAAWWGTARIAFVGGSLGSRGGQNMIEPAAYGAAVSFGPNTRNFRDTVQRLLGENAAVVVRDGRELAEFVDRCLAEPEWTAALGGRAQRLVQAQQGAADRTLELLRALAGQRAANCSRAA
jgi:3-deoxy-D-manno-octulosonic-acid transferase